MIVNTLKNGIRVIVKPVPGLKSVSVEVMIKMGAKYENESEQGMSHFWEHMAFKGTEKRPRMIDIAREIEGRGAEYNAETGLETVSFNITTIRENLEWSMEMVADIVNNSIFEDNEIAKEKGVISEEIKMYQDNPMMGLRDEFVKYLYGQSSLGCWNVSGEIKDVNKISRKSLVDYKNRYLNLKRMVVVIAGDVDDGDKSVEVVAKYFGDKINIGKGELPKVTVKLTDVPRRDEHKEMEQAHFCLGVPTFGRRDKRKYGLKLMEVILSGNTSSRLFNKIRLEKGWAYYVASAGQNIDEAGFWAVQSGVQQDKVNEAIELTIKEMVNFYKNVNQKEIDMAKSYLVGRLKMQMDRSEFWSEYLGEKLLLEDEVGEIDQEVAKLTEVKLNEVKMVAKETLKESRTRLMVFSRFE